MTAYGDMREFEHLDAVMHTAHTEAIGAITARIDIDEYLRQLLHDVENPPRASGDAPDSSRPSWRRLPGARYLKHRADNSSA